MHAVALSCKAAAAFTFLNDNKDMNERSWSYPNLAP